MRSLSTAVLLSVTLVTLVAEPYEPPPEQILKQLHLHSGMVVAEIGSSDALRISLQRAVGSLGKVTIVKPAADGETDLAIASLDVTVISDSLLHMQNMERLLAEFRSAIKPQGRLFVLSTPEEYPATAAALENAGFDPTEVHPLGAQYSLLEFTRP